MTMRTEKISLPDWVYRNLNDFGNCALPNDCNDIPKERLEKHLSEKMGRPIVCRLADFVKVESTAKKLEINQHYYIAEDKK